MKHPSSREFFAYWDKKRGAERAPERMDMEPQAVRELLGDIFVLSYDNETGFPFRVAGTRVSALLGRDLRDQSFAALFAENARREITDIITAVTEETLPAIAGLTATAEDGSLAHLELLLLPFMTRAHAPISLTGVLAPFEANSACSANSASPRTAICTAPKNCCRALFASCRSPAVLWSMRVCAEPLRLCLPSGSTLGSPKQQQPFELRHSRSRVEQPWSGDIS